MSFSFFKPSRPKSPQELAKAINESLLALDSKTVAEVKSREKVNMEDNVLDIHEVGSYLIDDDEMKEYAMEEVDRNFMLMRYMICGDGESEMNPDHALQLALDLCKSDAITLFIHKLPILGWQARKDLVICWCILLKQEVDSSYCCVEYIEKNLELLDFLVVCYDNNEIALNCGHMLRECIKLPSLTRYILESASFELFFKFVELPSFDVASDAFTTFKDLLTRHGSLVSEFLISHYDEFFSLYAGLLASSNYVTRRQSLKVLSEFLLEPQNSYVMKHYISQVEYLKIMMMLLKDSRKNIKISAFHIFKVFVANPNKSRDIKIILSKNSDGLLLLLGSITDGSDEDFEDEKGVVIKEIERLRSFSEPTL